MKASIGGILIFDLPFVDRIIRTRGTVSISSERKTDKAGKLGDLLPRMPMEKQLVVMSVLPSLHAG